MSRLAIALLLFGATICLGQPPENRYKLADPGDAAEFVNQLRNNSIPFRVDKNGSIWYPSDKEETVTRLLSEVLAERGRGVNYPDPIDMQSLKDKLARAGIPYHEVTRLGKLWIVWDPSFDDRANAIQEEVDNESSDRYRKNRRRDQVTPQR